ADVAILSLGTRLAEAMTAAAMLEAEGISVTVADARFAKPLDEALILQLAAHHKAILTVEEGAIGGFGAQVSNVLEKRGKLAQIALRTLFLPDVFMEHGKPEAMYAEAGLNADAMVKEARALVGKQMAAKARA